MGEFEQAQNFEIMPWNMNAAFLASEPCSL